ncbi:MAG: hypothetical protein HQL32_16080 [Planctomycetes bacterium]|nr:hypothetical protein [Planctomycetota bacterium]
MNPTATAIILFQASLLRSYRKRYPHLRLTNEERIELAKLGILIPKEWLKQWAPDFSVETYKRWFDKLVSKKWDYSDRNKKRSVGRPQSSVLIEKYVVRACRENPNWGDRTIANNATRLYEKVSDSTIRRIRKKHGIPPATKRKKSNWKALKDCGKVWGCDFFTQEVFTSYGLQTFYVLVFIHWKTRELIYAGATEEPNEQWVINRIRDFNADGKFEGAKYIVHDNDTIFSKAVDNSFEKESNLFVTKTAFHAPKMNSHTERAIRTMRELIGSRISWGERKFRRQLRAASDFYNKERHHQGLDGKIPLPDDSAFKEMGRVKRYSRCDGNQSFYCRKAS